ncbi:hypothetical protein ACVJGD_005217 [Bradyrhizobium sp. USDA 10063]
MSAVAVGWAKRSVPTITSEMRMVGTAQVRLCPPYASELNYIGLYVRTSAGTFTPSLIWPTDLMMSSPSNWAKQA